MIRHLTEMASPKTIIIFTTQVEGIITTIIKPDNSIYKGALNYAEPTL